MPALTTWTVGETITGPEGVPLFKTYGTANALAAKKQIVLLIRKGNTDAEGFAVVPVDAGETHFGGGKFLFLNAAKIQVGGIVGDQKFLIEPGGHHITKPSPGPDGRRCHSSLYFQKGEEMKNFFSSFWPVSPHARGLVFFFQDPQTSRIWFHSIRDFQE